MIAQDRDSLFALAPLVAVRSYYSSAANTVRTVHGCTASWPRFALNGVKEHFEDAVDA